jgi:hypothetical protein
MGLVKRGNIWWMNIMFQGATNSPVDRVIESSVG